jgi:ferredoxin
LKKVSVELEEPTDVQETLLFGVCPCDARGFEILDKVFLNKESYYTARREATTVVSLTCANPKSTCFCTSVGGSPASTGGADVLLTKVEGGYFAEPITEKGEALLNDPLLSDGSSKQAEAEKVKENALSKMKKVFDGDGIPEKILSLYGNEDFWRDVSAKCLSCGLCTYLCPTCYCFNITDEAVGLNGERIRTWDSCMFFHYTLEGSGHNPRPTKLQRFRNRVGHKFCYYPQKYDGVFGCVGCGRCIRSCPVSMDIRQVITQAKEA